MIATITLFSIAWNEIVNFDPDNLGGRHIDRLAVELIEITDIILLGTVLYIVALGLYQLFIDQKLALPRWLKVNDLTDLKRDLIGGRGRPARRQLPGRGRELGGESDVLPLGAAVALVIAALGFILWLTPKQARADDAAEP